MTCIVLSLAGRRDEEGMGGWDGGWETKSDTERVVKERPGTTQTPRHHAVSNLGRGMRDAGV